MSDRPFPIDRPMVRRLLRSQLPAEWAALAEAPLQLLGQGWDNLLYRLGEDHVVRLPLRRAAAELAQHEISWVEAASAPLRGRGLAVPIPVFVGDPGRLLPWVWTIVPFLPGEDLSVLPIGERDGVVEPLARALVALHRAAPREAPRNPYRGVSLADRALAIRDRWPSVTAWLGPDHAEVIRAAWDRSLRAPAWPGPPLWTHGDLHPRNILQDHGRLVGLIDFGDVAAGDPAVDLAVAWLALDEGQRERFWAVVRDEGSYDEAVQDRAIGWAVVIYTAMVADPVTRRIAGPLLEDIRRQLH